MHLLFVTQALYWHVKYHFSWSHGVKETSNIYLWGKQGLDRSLSILIAF